MKHFKQLLLVAVISTLLGGTFLTAIAYPLSGSTAVVPADNPNDFLPAYGDIPRTYAEKLQDEKLIADSTQNGVSKKEGAQKFITAGWTSYKSKKPKLAIREFNKAWLLDPANYQIYWGFALSSSMLAEFDSAIKWFTKAKEMDADSTDKRQYAKLLTDFGRTYYLKGLAGSKEECKPLIDKGITLFTEASQLAPDLATIYTHWSLALDMKRDYTGALDMINKAKDLGDKNISPRYLEHLHFEIAMTSKGDKASLSPISQYCDKIQAKLVKKCESKSALDKMVIVDFEVDSQGQIYGVQISPKSETLSEESKKIAQLLIMDLKKTSPPPADCKFPIRLSASLRNKPEDVGVYLRDLDWGPYVNAVQFSIKRCWLPPKGSESCDCRVLFYVNRDGTISDLKISKSSGIDLYDQVALNTVQKATPFLPFPDGASAKVGIDFCFNYNVFKGGSTP